MKRVLVLAMMLVIVMSVGAFAQAPASGDIAIELNVHPYAVVTVPTKEVKFDVAGNGSNDTTGVVEVNIQSNAPIHVTVESKGLHQGNDPIPVLNETVRYTVSGLGYHNFRPGSVWYNDVIDGAAGLNRTYKLGLHLIYTPGTKFHEVLAGTYSDTISWTVAAK